MVDSLASLVAIESPTADLAGCVACADAVGALASDVLGAVPEKIDVDGRPFLRWTFGTPRVTVVGHLDTVWPLGTTARWPFSIDGDVATGPGAFDMKAGIVQGFFGLATLDDLDGLVIVINADEETGSRTSRALIEESAAGTSAALILEPSAGGALKIARKGVSMYDIEVVGRASHAGLEPEKGVNATVELAHQVLNLLELARPSAGTSVTPTVATSGTTDNTVPASAWVHVDVRAFSVEEQTRIDDEIRALRQAVPGSDVRVHGGPNRPPLPESSSAKLFERASRHADALGLPPLKGVAVGGGSDGNFTAGIGIPTLDGLGAVGDNAHAEGEHLSLDAMPERAALFTELVADLLSS